MKMHLYIVGASLPSGTGLALEDAGFKMRSFESIADFLDEARRLTRGVVLVDLPGAENALTEFPMLLRRGAVIALIGTVPQGDVALATEAMRAGAFDVVTRPIDSRRLLMTVAAAARLVPDRGPLEQLSDRERDVFAGMVEGLTNKQMGIRLGISHRTVEIHRAHIMHKLGASNFAEAISRVFDQRPKARRRLTQPSGGRALPPERVEHLG
jgi:two-component system response regulator FixJ